MSSTAGALRLDEVAHAVADRTRREILRLVSEGERPVATIAAHFEVTRPAISQHLKVLRDADLVTVRQEGTRRYYAARPEGLRGLATWMEQFWGDALGRLAAEVEAEARRRRMGIVEDDGQGAS